MTRHDERFAALLETVSARHDTGVLLGVHAPLQGIRFRGAAGAFGRGSERPITIDDGFRIASMSKVFTAVLVMRLVERGTLSLGDTLVPYFEPALLDRLHPDSRRITLEHLLNHTAGLWDFALTPAWSQEIRSDPLRFREPQEILQWAVDHAEPVGAVGERHVYSDTGYVLLGRMLEIVTGTSYAAQCREHILEPLGMTDTWLEGHEAPRSSLSHCYSGDWDALAINGCLDWAAGGHVSTLADLERFLLGLFRGELVAHTTLDRMLVPVATPNHHYGLGIGIRRESAPGEPATMQSLWGHGGHWGSFMQYIPNLRATITGTINFTGQDFRPLYEAILGVVLDRTI
ncbi:MAG: beta-lactamase family protein [Pseudomonadales bacterium]|nr:beta-lactamase family protein [Pseudomonadales bacterium]